jgi:hypothetical protein
MCSHNTNACAATSGGITLPLLLLLTSISFLVDATVDVDGAYGADEDDADADADASWAISRLRSRSRRTWCLRHELIRSIESARVAISRMKSSCFDVSVALPAMFLGDPLPLPLMLLMLLLLLPATLLPSTPVPTPLPRRAAAALGAADGFNRAR